MKKQFAGLALATAAVLAATGLSAVPAAAISNAPARCEGCSGDQMEQRAIALGVGTHVITSVSTNEMVKYRVTLDYEDKTTLWAEEVAVDASYWDILAGARELYAASAGTMHAAVEVRADDLGMPGLTGMSAGDVMRNENLKTQLGDRLKAPLPNGVHLLDEQFFQTLFALIEISDGSVEITVVFADGTSVVYRRSVSIATTTYQKDRSRTPGPNPQLIPEDNTKVYQGTWAISGTVGRNLVLHLDEIGAVIEYFSGFTGSGTMTCTWTEVGGVMTLRCKVE